MSSLAPRHESLFSLLKDHVSADEQEARHLAQMRQLCESIAHPLSRSTYVPGHFTASAFVLSPTRDALLLIFHGKLQRWLQPGGHVEPDDEHLLAAALREAREEVGIANLTVERSTPFDLDVHEIPENKREPAHRHYDLRFLLRARDLSFVAGSDAKAARWVPLREIELETSDRSVMRAVEKLRRELGH